MKTKTIMLFTAKLIVLSAIFLASSLLFSCNNDKSHSATDGGNMRMMTTDTLNQPDTTRNVQP